METPFHGRARIAALATLVVGLSGAFAASAHAAPATVTVSNDTYNPGAVTINQGEAVTWDFKESSHNVKGDGWSGNNSYGTGTWSKTFDAPGTYTYVCEAHPSDMKGTVTVNAAAAPAPTTPAPGSGAPGAGPTAGAASASAPGAAWTFPSAEDRLAPAITRLSASMRRGARRPTLTVRLSEQARLVVAVRRVLSARVATAAIPTVRLQGKKGLNRYSLRVRGLRRGKYRIRAIAIDAAGNESQVRTATLRVRR
jgi:plastocyanin